MGGEKLALVIATYEYEDPSLRTLVAPASDAQELSRVLSRADIGGFRVETLVNQPHYVVGEAIGEFFASRRRDDLVLLYFTGHGLKDDEGRLFLAMTNTRKDRLLFTGISADQINIALEGCFSRQKVLILDCCYSGAFPLGRTAKADEEIHTVERFRGRGRVVLTASDATSYSFDGEVIRGSATQSVFTRHLIEGIESGSADLDGDGDISLDELYSYVYEQVTQAMPQQRPKKQEDVEGRIVVARNANWTLPSHLKNAIQSPLMLDRLSAVQSLGKLIREGNIFVQTQSRVELRRLVDDDSRSVSAAASELLSRFQSRAEGDGERAEQEAQERADRDAKERAERDAKMRAEREAEERAERDAKVRAEREAEERAEREERLQRAQREARQHTAQQRLDREAQEQDDRRVDWHAQERPQSGARSTLVPILATAGGVGLVTLFVWEHAARDLTQYPVQVLFSSFIIGGLLVVVTAIAVMAKRLSYTLLHGMLVGVGSYFVVEAAIALWTVLGSGSPQWHLILIIALLVTGCGILAEQSRRRRDLPGRLAASFPPGVLAQASSPPTSYSAVPLGICTILMASAVYYSYSRVRSIDRGRGRIILLLSVSPVLGCLLAIAQWTKSDDSEPLAALSLQDGSLAALSAGWTLIASALALVFYVLSVTPEKGGARDLFFTVSAVVYLMLLAFSRVGLFLNSHDWQLVVEGLCYGTLAIVAMVSFKLSWRPQELS